MTPVVLVELSAAEAGSPHAGALVSACTAGLRQGECVLSTPEASSAHPTAIAIVTWNGDEHLDAVVELGVEKGGGPQWVSRQLRFHAADVEEERWRSVGFAVAGLWVDSSPPSPPGGAEAPPSGREAPSPAPAAPHGPPRVKRAARRGPLLVAARAETGPGLDRGSWRSGATTSLGYELLRGHLSLGVSAGYAIRPSAVDGVDVSWSTLGAGFDVLLALPGDSEARVGAALVTQEIRAAETDSISGLRESGSRWLGGGLAALSVTWPRSGAVGAFLGGQILRLSGATGISSHEQHLAASPALSPAVFVGVELRLPAQGPRY